MANDYESYEYIKGALVPMGDPAKVSEYLNAGAQMVWIVEPVLRMATVYRSSNNIKALTINDALNGEDVIEGFQCSVAEIFD